MPVYVTVDADALATAVEALEARPDLLTSAAVGYLRRRLDEAPRHAQVEELPLQTGELDAGNLEALGVAHHRPDHATSVAAAEHITLTAGTLRARALAALVAAGSDGLTDVELEQRLEVRRPTGGNRRGELVKLGLVQSRPDDDAPGSVKLRTVPGHLAAIVWVAVPDRAIPALEELGYRVQVLESGAGGRQYLVADPPTDDGRPPRVRLEVRHPGQA